MNLFLYIPTINASLNLLSLVFLILGFIFIRKGNKHLHKRLMISAFISSAVFLIFYLIYHYYAGHKVYNGVGVARLIYLLILFTHVILAVLMVPFILATFFYAFKADFNKHKKLAKITFPVWVYVSLTGVIVYVLLYRVNP